MIKCFQQTISYTLRHKTNNTTCEWAIFLIIYVRKCGHLFIVNILRFYCVLPFWSQLNDTGKAILHDRQALYRGFSYAAKYGPSVDSDATDCFNSPHFQNMSTAEVNAPQKQLLPSIIIS
jgi:hypothetical protein